MKKYLLALFSVLVIGGCGKPFRHTNGNTDNTGQNEKGKGKKLGSTEKDIEKIVPGDGKLPRILKETKDLASKMDIVRNFQNKLDFETANKLSMEEIDLILEYSFTFHSLFPLMSKDKKEEWVKYGMKSHMGNPKFQKAVKDFGLEQVIINEHIKDKTFYELVMSAKLYGIEFLKEDILIKAAQELFILDYNNSFGQINLMKFKHIIDGYYQEFKNNLSIPNRVNIKWYVDKYLPEEEDIIQSKISIFEKLVDKNIMSKLDATLFFDFKLTEEEIFEAVKKYSRYSYMQEKLKNYLLNFLLKESENLGLLMLKGEDGNNILHILCTQEASPKLNEIIQKLLEEVPKATVPLGMDKEDIDIQKKNNLGFSCLDLAQKANKNEYTERLIDMIKKAYGIK